MLKRFAHAPLLSALSPATLLCVAALLCAPMAAQTGESGFRDAVLVDFSTQSTGQLCAGTSVTTAPQSAVNPSTTTRSESCGETHIRVYTLQVGDVTFVVKPVARGSAQVRRTALAIGTLGYGNRLIKPQDVLKDTSPGSHLLIQQDADGFTVKAGGKVSFYATLGGR